MAMEKNIVHQIQNYLHAQGAWVVKIHGGWFQRAGIPDLIGVLKGRFLAIEVKRPGEGLTRLQAYVLAQIRKAGGIAFKADSVDVVRETLDRELKSTEEADDNA